MSDIDKIQGIRHGKKYQFESPINVITGRIAYDVVRAQNDYICSEVTKIIGVEVDEKALFDALKGAHEQYTKGYDEGYADGYEKGKADADAEREGRWKIALLDHEAFGVRPKVLYCSECNQCIAYPTRYCPNCGARMEEENENR